MKGMHHVFSCLCFCNFPANPHHGQLSQLLIRCSMHKILLIYHVCYMQSLASKISNLNFLFKGSRTLPPEYCPLRSPHNYPPRIVPPDITPLIAFFVMEHAGTAYRTSFKL